MEKERLVDLKELKDLKKKTLLKDNRKGKRKKNIS